MFIHQDIKLTVDDVLLVPKVGKLDSRKNAKVRLNPYIFSAPMESVSGYEFSQAATAHPQLLPVISRFISKEDYYRCILERPGWHAVGFDNYKEVLSFIKEHNIKVALALDIANGAIPKALKVYKELSNHPNVSSVMSGSICTVDQAIAVLNTGVHCLRVGVGPGSACTTRIVTGCGYPQLSAVNEIYTNTHNWSRHGHKFIIADGGIRNSGDIVKYLAAGADAVMLGSMLANTKESDGWSGDYKTYKGQASKEFHQTVLNKEQIYVEGVATKVLNRNHAPTLESVLTQIEAGIASAISYLGLESIEDLKPENVEFIRITSNGMKESQPHGL